MLGTGRLRFLGGSFGTFECTNSLVKPIFEYFLAKTHAICQSLNQSGYLKLVDRKQFGKRSLESADFTMSCFAFQLWIEKINICFAMGAK